MRGPQEAVRAFQVEQQAKGGDWAPAGNYVPPGAEQQGVYKQLLDRAAFQAKDVLLRVRAIGAGGETLVHSPVKALSSECEGGREVDSVERVTIDRS